MICVSIFQSSLPFCFFLVWLFQISRMSDVFACLSLSACVISLATTPPGSVIVVADGRTCCFLVDE